MPNKIARTAKAVLNILNMNRIRCRACGRPTSPRDGLCDACREALPAVETGYCPACGRVTGGPADAPSLCGGCAAAPKPWGRLYFHGRHEGMLRELILGWKFFGRIGLTGLLGDLAAWSVRAVPGSCDLVVPVPLHAGRLKKRGFNQSLELARISARWTGSHMDHRALERVRATAVQSLMNSVKERRENIFGAFRADPARVRGARIILVDDVLTTGATMEECARTLLDAGAKRVDASVISRAVSH